MGNEKDILKSNAICGISHLAIVVFNMEKALEEYRLLGFEIVSDEVVEETFGIKARVIEKSGYVIELISPLDSDNSNYAEYKKQNKYCLDHICYETSDFNQAIEELKRNRFFPVSAERISGVWNRKVILMGNRRMGLIELIEKEN